MSNLGSRQKSAQTSTMYDDGSLAISTTMIDNSGRITHCDKHQTSSNNCCWIEACSPKIEVVMILVYVICILLVAPFLVAEKNIAMYYIPPTTAAVRSRQDINRHNSAQWSTIRDNNVPIY